MAVFYFYKLPLLQLKDFETYRWQQYHLHYSAPENKIKTYICRQYYIQRLSIELTSNQLTTISKLFRNRISPEIGNVTPMLPELNLIIKRDACVLKIIIIITVLFCS